MKYLTFIFLVFLSVTTSQAQDTLRVLFLGNSYTNNNNLPALVASIADSQGDLLVHDKNTPGGHTLEGHTNNATSQNKIAEGDWDFVVMQEQSQLPSFPPGQVENQVLPFAEELVGDIRDVNPCTEPMFFMTWGRENGDQSNCEFYEPLCTYEGMQSRLTSSYNLMAMDNDANVSPVGEAWRRVRATYPEIGLYAGDGSHPSINGSFLAACVFYNMLFDKEMGNGYYIPNGVEESDAEKLRTIAEETVFDELEQWNFSLVDIELDVTFELNDPSITLTNNTNNVSNHLWEFGDGTTSMDANPSNHEYTEDGTYEVIYTASNDCNTENFSFEIMIVSLSNEDWSSDVTFDIYPNPSSGAVYFRTDINAPFNIRIFDVNGQLIKDGVYANGDALSLHQWPKGNYWLEVEWNNQRKIMDLIIR